MRLKHIPCRLILMASIVCGGLLGLWRSHSDFPIVKAGPPQSPPAEPTKVAVYDPDPNHLWNRLYSVLYVRTDQKGRVYGEDQLDPILWYASKYLLTEPRHRQALLLLDEFFAKDGEQLIKDPLKRAFFQRDLWAIFDWLVSNDYRGEWDGLSAERRELRVRLARMIRRLALSAEQIQALPDDYAATVAAKVFPAKHDPTRPETAYLPPDLLDPDGPWVVLERNSEARYTAEPIAPQHVRFAEGRSAFFVVLRLPEGRKATLAYLEKLREFPNPMKDHRDPRAVDYLNPDLPNVPPGAQIALVRQMSVIDDKGKITPTKLIEMVQLRVFREVPGKDDLSPKGTLHSFKPKDDAYEFRLRRKALFAGKSGGLRVIRLETRDYDLFSKKQTENSDRFEHLPDSPRSVGPLSFGECQACHGRRGPGIHSVLSYGVAQYPLVGFLDSSRQRQQAEAIGWKERNHAWGFLLGLLEGQGKQ